MLNAEFKLFEAFLHNPSKELYGREIERLAGTTHERTITYLNKLVNQKALIREKRGRQVFYRINKEHELVQKALSFAELKKRIEFSKHNEIAFTIQNLVSQELKEYQTSIYFIILFGSVARKQNAESSDIDLLLVLIQDGKIKSKLEEIIKRREKITGGKISLHAVTIEELEKGWLKEPIYKNIWDERIVFYGEENFWRFVLKNGEPL
jgi:predicted nucleotidyltransferase